MASQMTDKKRNNCFYNTISVKAQTNFADEAAPSFSQAQQLTLPRQKYVHSRFSRDGIDVPQTVLLEQWLKVPWDGCKQPAAFS
jgi:hypothetical protein